jgi:hypothetical protein
MFPSISPSFQSTVLRGLPFRGLTLLCAVMFSMSVSAGEPPASELSSNLVQREQAAKQVTQQLLKQLGSHLKSEMKTNGPLQAISVCKDVAPQLASELSLENGWRVTRVSAKPRNALLGSADAWEQKVLVEFEARAKAGEKYSSMSKAEVIKEGDKSYFRFMKPLPVKPICLTCHGSDEQIPATVKVELDKQYPFDQARDYKAGDLRGAVTIKQPMDIPLRKKF